jgi:L-lactate dehydrogenase complex protein LldF
MRIPLPKMMRALRETDFEQRLGPAGHRMGLGLWAWFARRPALYRAATRLAIALLGRLGRRRGRFASLPLATGWTVSRDLPAPEGATFQTLWRKGRRA